MAQITSSRSNTKVFYFLGLFNILMLLQNANCYEFKVGGSGDWSVPMDANANNYNQWAERSRFQIGDTLSFSYSADKDSVLLVNKADFDNCNTASPIEKYSDGQSVVKFNHSGAYFFISGVHDNCVKNEKLHLVVMADRSHNNQTASSPPPSPSVDEVPPSPAPSGEEPPSPPSDSGETNQTPAPSQESSPPKNGASSTVMSFVGSAAPRTRPLFRVTSDSREQFKGSSPSACWNKVYKQMRKTQVDNFDESISSRKSERTFGSGSHMFGFSHPEISKLIKELSKSKILAKSLKLASSKNQDLPAGYRSVRVKWKDLDKCNVCHMDEEYENNLFLQCDKCRMMVHARCYGEREPMDGVLWLCNLCRPGAPVVPPPCCLCPVIGGAMKPTTDGRWAHLACAIWIPETCLSDIKKMEPIDGLSRINKDRWKLLCSICSVPYGACIQCSNPVCRVAYHPLCARAAGFCVELEDEDRLHLIPMDDDELDQCIRLLSFCKKHRAVSNERPAVDECVGQKACEYSDYVPPPNPSGCARSEPYNYFGRRGRKEPEVLTAASLKRLYVENRPYLVGGHSQHDQSSNTLSSSCAGSKHTFDLQKLRCSQLTSRSIVSMVEKYNYMKETLGQRLAFGKSGIHGFGIFAKLPQKAGDMVIEYTGELVRPPIADRREHLIYNSLVGAGTYMFRIDDQRVIDATRAGSIAHLINHSCEPNCYSRVISVNSIDHIIIFSKRDIEQWEELTYDYRFLSIDEQLACYCGFPRCRGVVNDTEAEERMAKLYAPRSELIDWEGE